MTIISKIKCPHCDHIFTSDDIEKAEHDLFELARNEEGEYEYCPGCGEQFYIQGGWNPEYETASTHCEI